MIHLSDMINCQLFRNLSPLAECECGECGGPGSSSDNRPERAI